MIDQAYLDRLAFIIKKFKPNLHKNIFDQYEVRKSLSSGSRPLDDSITLQELLQQMFSCGLTKEELAKILNGPNKPIEINLC